MNHAALRDWRNNPPAAFVIDLSRMPSQGRDVAIALRGYKTTRHTPLVFVEGEPEKVERIKVNLPDAVYTSWSRIRGSLKRPSQNLRPAQSCPRQISRVIRARRCPRNSASSRIRHVALVGAPKDFEKTLGELPEGVKLKKRADAACDLIIWFVRMRAELYDRIKEMGELTGAGGLWIAWPKQASGVASDMTQNVVRETGLASGLVDYKVCAIDATWSGLKFARRKAR